MRENFNPFFAKCCSVELTPYKAKDKKYTSWSKDKPDLTKKQRDEDEKFIRSLDEENESEPKDDLGDFRWKLAGPPGNLRKVKMRNIQEWEQAQERRTRREEAAE